MAKQLDKPMTEIDFQQLTLVANSIAVFQMAIKLEPPGSQRRKDYADILMRLRRVEKTIPGYLSPEISNVQSVKFYERLGDAVAKFMDSYNTPKLLGRDAQGRFIKI